MPRNRSILRILAFALLLAIGALHTAVGVVGGRSLLAKIIQAGAWDTVSSHGAPLTPYLLLWFLASGWLLIVIGHLGVWLEYRAEVVLPRFVGLEIAALGVPLAIVSGGGWPALVITVVGLFLLFRPARHSGPTAAPVSGSPA